MPRPITKSQVTNNTLCAIKSHVHFSDSAYTCTVYSSITADLLATNGLNITRMGMSYLSDNLTVPMSCLALCGDLIIEYYTKSLLPFKL